MWQKIRCVIIDDEPLAREILEQFVAECDSVELLASFASAVEAREYVRSKPVDLLLLDINLPELSGVDFIKTLPKAPLVVFTTAYPQYALDGFEVDAVDYLLKPIPFARFQKAMAKVEERLFGSGTPASNSMGFVMLKSNKKMYKVDLNSILYVEAVGDYVKVCTVQQNIIVHDTIKNIQELLGDAAFARVHKSYIIALDKISFIEGNMVKVGDMMVPVSLFYKELFLQKLR